MHSLNRSAQVPRAALNAANSTQKISATSYAKTRTPLGSLKIAANAPADVQPAIRMKGNSPQSTATLIQQRARTPKPAPAPTASVSPTTSPARPRTSTKQQSPGRSSPQRSGRSKYKLIVDYPSKYILQQQDPQYHDKLVVVLDLDETLAYGRTFGHPKLRPHLHKFLQTLQGLECEVVLWTAGERGYAFSMLEVIDPHGCLFQHCVYRHPRWWSGPRGHKKDLALLGRPLERTFIVENTPDCVRDCVANAILVSDYVGPVAGALGRTQPDHVLSELAQCIQGMWSEIQSGVVSSVAQALQRSPFLIQRTVGADHVPCSVTTWTLRSDPRILQCNMPARCSPDPSEDILDRVLDSTYAMSSICYNSNKPKNSEKRFATTSALRSNTMMVAGTRDGSKEVGQATRWLSHLDVKCSVSDPSSLMHPIRFSTVPQKKSVGLKSPSRTWKDTGLESSQDTLSKSQGSVVDPTSRAIIGAGRKVLGEYTAALNRLNIATGKNHKVHRYPRKNTLGFRDF